MLEKSNAALIEAIHAHTPQHSNPASLLMDMLNIGREAAYRRLRGEVPFTFGEASALCARMHFSLDRVVGLAATDKLSFQLKFKEFTALLETYNEILERDIAFMREVASDPTTEFATATNSLPAEFYGKYDNLNRFKLFKWLYQHEVGNPAVRTFEELKLPAELRRNCREYVRWVQSVATTYLIFDDSNFKHWLNALRAYREIHLISQESVRVLRDELFAMLDEMETVAVKGEFENGNKIFLYLSDIDLESSYSYVTTSRHQAVNIGMFSLNGLRTPDPLMYEYVKKWIKTQSRFSTLISGSGELRRIHYFKRQREIVAQLGDAPFPMRSLSGGHERKGEGFTTLPSKPPDVRNIVASLSSNPSNFCGRHYMQTEFFIAPFGTGTNVRHFSGRTKTKIETIRNAMF